MLAHDARTGREFGGRFPANGKAGQEGAGFFRSRFAREQEIERGFERLRIERFVAGDRFDGGGQGCVSHQAISENASATDSGPVARVQCAKAVSVAEKRGDFSKNAGIKGDVAMAERVILDQLGGWQVAGELSDEVKRAALIGL